MCTAGFNHFGTCGHSTPDHESLTHCEYAKISGRTCPDFQISEDYSESRSFDMLACMNCS